MAKAFNDPFDNPETVVQVGVGSDELDVDQVNFADPFDQPEPETKPGPLENYFDTGLQMLGKGVSDIKEMGTDLYDAFVGGPQDESIPELSQANFDTAGQAGKMAATYATTVDDKAIARVAEQTIPGAKQGTDEYGNVTLTFNGKTYYVNRPGASGADLYKLIADGISYLPAARGAKYFAGLLPRLGFALPAGFLTSLLQDQASLALGSGQDPSMERGLYAGLGSMFGEVLAPAARAAWNALVGNRRFFRNGTLTDEGMEAASRAGLSPEDLPRVVGSNFAKRLREARQQGATNPEQQAAADMATDEFGVDFTRAQRTQDPQDIQRELSVRGNVLGEKGTARMKAMDAKQEEQIIKAADDFQQSFVEGDRSPNMQTAAADIQQNIKGKQEAGLEGVRQQYKQVREIDANDPVLFTDKGMDTLENTVTKDFNEQIQFYDPDTSVRVKKVFSDISNKLKKITTTLGDEFIADPKAPASYNQFEVLRRRIVAMRRTANADEKRQLDVIKRSMDKWLDTAVIKSIQSGDPAILEAIKKARAFHSEQQKRFSVGNNKDVAGKFIEKILAPETTPEQVTRALFGMQQVFSGNSNAIINRIKEISPEKIPQLQELFWMRMVEPVKTTKLGQQGLTKDGKGRLRTTILKNLKENKTVMENLFNPEQIAKMKRFAATIDRAITPTDNPSGSGYVVGRLARQFLEKIGVPIAFVTGNPAAGIAIKAGASTAGNIASGRSAAKAIRSGRSRGSMPIVPSAGFAISDELDPEEPPSPPIR